MLADDDADAADADDDDDYDADYDADDEDDADAVDLDSPLVPWSSLGATVSSTHNTSQQSGWSGLWR